MHAMLRFNFLHQWKRRPERCCLPPLHIHRLHFIAQRLEHLLPEGPPSAVPPEAEVSGRSWAERPEIAPCDLLLRLLRLPLLPLSKPLAGVHNGICAALARPAATLAPEHGSLPERSH